MKKFGIIVLIFFFIFCFYNFSYSQNYPNRIIPLGPAITEQLYILGVGDKIIANTIYCTRPPDAEKKEKIGTVVEQNIEKIISLKPDLVIATSLTNPRTIKKLKDLGIKVVSFIYAKSFDELCEHFIELGKIVGKKKESKEIVKRAKKEVENIYKKTKNLKKQKVIVQIGAKPLFVATKDSFINDFIKFAGGKNLGPKGSGIYSREKILRQNPDVIIITTMGIAGEEEKKIWQKYKTLNAVKNNRIYIVDAHKLCSPTPISFVETLKEIVGILHPKNE